MSVHKGEILEKAIRSSGYPISKLAKKINKSRRHIYNLFENPNVSIELLMEIGKIINHDFSKEVKDIRNISHDNENYWKEKYYQLLEKHQLLLENKMKVYFKK